MQATRLLERSRLGGQDQVARKDAFARSAKERQEYELNNLADYFKTPGMRLGVFYPTHHLMPSSGISDATAPVLSMIHALSRSSVSTSGHAAIQALTAF